LSDEATDDPKAKRKLTLRSVATALTTGTRDSDKTVRKTTAAGGATALAIYALQVFQAQATAWREQTQKQNEAVLAVMNRQVEATNDSKVAMEGLKGAMAANADATRDLALYLGRKNDRPQEVRPSVQPVRRTR